MRMRWMVFLVPVALLSCSSEKESKPPAVLAATDSTATTETPATAAPTTEKVSLPSGAKQSDPDGVVAVFARIDGMSECPALQDEFDTASESHDAQLKAGNTALSGLSLRYMEAADKRARKVGCY